MKHLQVPETKPNNKNTKTDKKMQRLDGQSYYRVNDCKSTVFKEFLNADREVKLIRSGMARLRRKVLQNAYQGTVSDWQ